MAVANVRYSQFESVEMDDDKPILENGDMENGENIFAPSDDMDMDMTNGSFASKVRKQITSEKDTTIVFVAKIMMDVWFTCTKYIVALSALE